MRKKGSITVFLSLVLVLLFSFVLTALEAARIRGATAYISMLSELAGDSFLAGYYYPLFREYRLFGVDAGDENGFFSESTLVSGLKENVTYGTKGISGGLLEFQNTVVELNEYETMMSGGGAEFLSQVKQQTVLDGLSLALEELFSEELFTEAGVVGEIYREQEETLAATATVTAEILRLMELADGISMGKEGIAFDENGKLQAKESFIKQLVPMEQEEIKAAYDVKEVFRATSGGFFRADRAAWRVQNYISQADSLSREISVLDDSIFEYQRDLAALEKAWQEEKTLLDAKEKTDDTLLLLLEAKMKETESAIETAETTRQEYDSQQEDAVSKAKTEYNRLMEKLDGVQSLVEEALDVVEELEKKQVAARVVVTAYEIYLESMESLVSEELYQVFLQELQTMKAYVGLEEQGYSVETMRQSLSADRELLEAIAPAGFSEGELSGISDEMNRVISRMPEYTVEGLWFTYGDIVVAEQTGTSVTEALSELLKTGILSLVGISKEEQSDRSLDGKDLPSAGLAKENILEELMACIEETEKLFQDGGIGEALKSAGNAALDATALELYSMKYFHSFGEESPYTKLNYEREYLVFGAEEDKTNLLCMVLSLVAIRTLFSMVMIVKQPDRMNQLESIATGVAGFTGIPVLAAVIKYGLLLLWSVEEALVEVAALVQGKRIAVVGTGTISFGEVFLCGKTMIAEKAKSLPEGAGAAYRDYLALLSLTRPTKEKAYRAMDLIQENIRYRYDDSFRMRNAVTGISYCTKSELEELFDTGVFVPAAYELECPMECAY